MDGAFTAAVERAIAQGKESALINDQQVRR
jgi:hypothetical protein